MVLKNQIIKITFIILLLSTFVANAQMKSQVGWMSKFGLAGGVTASWLFPNYDEINKQLPGFKINKEFSGGMLTWGGSGYVYIMVVDDVRIGGMGYGGTQSLSNNFDGFNREVKYGLSAGAFTIEYTMPFVKRVGISVGTMVGGGKLTIEQFHNDGNYLWSETWEDFNNPNVAKDLSRKIESSFITITPTLNFDVPLTRFLAIRLGTGYQFTINESWTVDNEASINDVPSALNGDSFFIQTGIYLGFFAY